jgi:hypothetical protein
MKKKSLGKGSFMAFLSVLSMMLIGSCQSSPEAVSGKSRQAQNNVGPVTFKTVVKSETVPLSPDSGHEDPRMVIIMTIQNIPDRGKLGDLIRNTVFNGIDCEAYGEKVIAGYRSRYQEEGKLALAEGRALSESWNWEYNETIEGTEISPERSLAGISNCLVVCRSRDYYLGGAHGMREKQYFLFDTAKGKQISLDDLIRKNARMPLRQLAAAKLRKLAGIEDDVPLSRAGFFTDLPEIPENYFLTPKGLGFHWNPYEIAPYVTGPVEIVIPYDELIDALR